MPQSVFAQRVPGDIVINRVLQDPYVRSTIANPKFTHNFDVPYGAGPNKTKDGVVNIDRHVPQADVINGRRYDPARPTAVHEIVEQHIADQLQEGHAHAGNQIYEMAHHAAERAERMWIEKHLGPTAWGTYQQHWAQWLAPIEHENPPNPPPNLDKYPYPHRNVHDAPRTQETEPVFARAERRMGVAPTPKRYQEGGPIDLSNLESASNEMQLTPQEKDLYERHLRNLYGSGGVDNPPDEQNPQGSRSSLYQLQFGSNGKEYNVPTVYEGKILGPDEAINRAYQQGIENFPSYATPEEAEARYGQMHDYMNRDTQRFLQQRPGQSIQGMPLAYQEGGEVQDEEEQPERMVAAPTLIGTSGTGAAIGGSNGFQIPPGYQIASPERETRQPTGFQIPPGYKIADEGETKQPSFQIPPGYKLADERRPEEEGAVGTVARETAHEAVPLAAGIGTAALTGAGLGAIGAGPIGGFVGAIGGGIAGGIAASGLQEWALKKLGLNDEEQRAVNREAHPYAALAGEVALPALFGRPSAFWKAGARLPAAAGALLGGGLEAGQEAISGQDFDPKQIAAQAASMGVFSGAPTALGRAIMGPATAAGERLGARLGARDAAEPALPGGGAPQTPAQEGQPSPNIATRGASESAVNADKNAGRTDQDYSKVTDYGARAEQVQQAGEVAPDVRAAMAAAQPTEPSTARTGMQEEFPAQTGQQYLGTPARPPPPGGGGPQDFSGRAYEAPPLGADREFPGAPARPAAPPPPPPPADVPPAAPVAPAPSPIDAVIARARAREQAAARPAEPPPAAQPVSPPRSAAARAPDEAVKGPAPAREFFVNKVLGKKQWQVVDGEGNNVGKPIPNEKTANQQADKWKANPDEAPEGKVPRGPRKAAVFKRLNLWQFIASQGGISADEPRLADVRQAIGKGFVPGFGSLIRKKGEGGLTLDRLLQAAIESRHIQDPAALGLVPGQARAGENALLEALPGGRDIFPNAGVRERAGPSGRDIEEQQEAAQAKDAIRKELKDADFQGEPDSQYLDLAAYHVVKNDMAPMEAWDRASEEIDLQLKQAEDRANEERGASPPAGKRAPGEGAEPPGPGDEEALPGFGEGPRAPGEVRGPPRTEPTEAGEQFVLPGAEKISDAELAQRRTDERLKPTADQRPADEGLFGERAQQTDLAQKPTLAERIRKAQAERPIEELDRNFAEELLRRPQVLNAEAAKRGIPPEQLAAVARDIVAAEKGPYVPDQAGERGRIEAEAARYGGSERAAEAIQRRIGERVTQIERGTVPDRNLDPSRIGRVETLGMGRGPRRQQPAPGAEPQGAREPPVLPLQGGAGRRPMPPGALPPLPLAGGAGGRPPPPPRPPYPPGAPQPGFMGRALRRWQETFQPETVSSISQRAEPYFRTRAAAGAGERDRIYKDLQPGVDRWSRVPEQEQLDFLNKVERRQPVAPEQQADAASLRAALNEAHKLEAQWGSKAAWVDDYVPHEWDLPPPGKPPISKFFNSLGPTWFEKARTIDFIEAGTQAGYKLKASNPFEAVRSRLLAGAQMRMDMELLEGLRGMQMASKVASNRNAANLTRQGWVEVNAPDRERWMIHPDLVPLWNNSVAAKSLWASQSVGGEAFRGWMSVKNTVVPLKLALSAFHPLHVLHINMSTNLARAVGQAASGDFEGAFRSFGQAFTPYSKLGTEARAQWLLGENARTPEGKRSVKLLEEGGLTPMMDEKMRIDARQKFNEAVQAMNPFKIGLRGLQYGIQKVQAPLFEQWIPHLKAAAYLNDAEALLKRRPELERDDTERRIALSAIAKSNDNRFGEMFYSGLFWNRMVKDMGIGSFLSLGWNLGFVREFGGAALETATRPIGLLKAPSVERQIIRDATNKITFATIYLGTAAMIGGAMTKMLSGEDPKEASDYIFPKVGGVNPDGSPRRLNTMFYLREAPMLQKHIEEYGGGVGGTLAGTAAMVWNKMMLQPLKELWENKSYFGSEIWDTNAPAYQQVAQAMKHFVGEQISPMAVSGAQRAKETGGGAGEQALAYLGFGPAPKYAERSAIQNRIEHLYDRFVAPGARPYEDEEVTHGKQMARNQLLMAKQHGDPEQIKEAHDAAIKAGLPPKYLATLGRVDSDQRMFQRLPQQQQIAILDQATPEEQQRYWKYTSGKTKVQWIKEHPRANP